MSTSSYAVNLAKLRKIVLSTQSAIEDIEEGIRQTERVIEDFQTFKHTHSDDPTLVEVGAILPLSNLAALKVFNDIYTSQVKAKHKLIRTIDLACGRFNEATTGEFLTDLPVQHRTACLFSRPHVPIPLEITSTSSAFFLQDPVRNGIIQRNSVPIPPTVNTTFNFHNPAEHLPPPLELASLAQPHTIESLPPFCDLPTENKRPYPTPSLLKGNKLQTASNPPTKKNCRSTTNTWTFTELPTSQESAQEEDYLNFPGYDSDEEIHPIVGLGFQSPQSRSKHPTRPDTHDDNGSVFFKKLQVNDRVYNPYTRTFGRVVAWNRGQAKIRAVNKGTSATRPNYVRRIQIWSFGEFVIRLKCSRDNRRLYAQISPYTREDSALLKEATRSPAHLRTLSTDPNVPSYAAYHGSTK